ncbi:hypothetical protein ACFQLX_15380 [Streptomyces polyrhachis]|uniref:Uncharacterized protein n=1 Tax=Streptomyces polyrhachis TaxID=1282885 RepID=A0ABW2GJ24_9ACTN
MLNHGPGNRPGRLHEAHQEARARAAAAAGEGGHELSVREEGAFALAACSCGWIGPARRARSRAREDACAHGGG